MRGQSSDRPLDPYHFEGLESPALVRPDQPRIPRHVGGEDGGEAAGLAHVTSPAARRRPERNSSRSSGLRKRQIARHYQRGYGVQPGEDRARFVEPPHMGIDAARVRYEGGGSLDGLVWTGAASPPPRQTDV